MAEKFTNKELTTFKRFAKAACKAEGIKVNMKDMTILEAGCGFEGLDYVMFHDAKSDREYQCHLVDGGYCVIDYTEERAIAEMKQKEVPAAPAGATECFKVYRDEELMATFFDEDEGFKYIEECYKAGINKLWGETVKYEAPAPSITELPREEKRAAIRTINSNIKMVVECYKGNKTGKPSETVKAIVDSIGYDAAVVTIAEMVNCKGEWDGRIYSEVREWAKTVKNAASGEELTACHIYYPDEIHPAHMNQIAKEMMAFQNDPEPAATEQTSETEEHIQYKTSLDSIMSLTITADKQIVVVKDRNGNTITEYFPMNTPLPEEAALAFLHEQDAFLINDEMVYIKKGTKLYWEMYYNPDAIFLPSTNLSQKQYNKAVEERDAAIAKQITATEQGESPAAEVETTKDEETNGGTEAVETARKPMYYSLEKVLSPDYECSYNHDAYKAAIAAHKAAGDEVVEFNQKRNQYDTSDMDGAMLTSIREKSNELFNKWSFCETAVYHSQIREINPTEQEISFLSTFHLPTKSAWEHCKGGKLYFGSEFVLRQYVTDEEGDALIQLSSGYRIDHKTHFMFRWNNRIWEIHPYGALQYLEVIPEYRIEMLEKGESPAKEVRRTRSADIPPHNSMEGNLVLEMCPNCDREVEMVWNIAEKGFQSVCPYCGERLMLCDECLHQGEDGEYTDNCDYDRETDTCWRSRKT